MATLLLAEHDNKALKDATNKALTAAKALGGDVHVLVAGQGCRAVADAAAKLDGVKKVLIADNAAYEHQLAEPLAALVVSLASTYDAIVAPATTTGKNFMPRAAALLDVMQISDIIKVVSPDTFERPIYAGNAIQTVKSTDGKKVITVRTASFQAVGTSGSAAVEKIAAPGAAGISSFDKAELSKSDRPELTSARTLTRAACGSAASVRRRRAAPARPVRGPASRDSETGWSRWPARGSGRRSEGRRPFR